jgi:hypothetical protein
MQIENLLQGIHNHDLSIEMINVADKKHLYNRIKGMVDEEMKTNEHLFVEERPKFVRLLFISIVNIVMLNLIILIIYLCILLRNHLV